jgi:hypothetical protein
MEAEQAVAAESGAIVMPRSFAIASPSIDPSRAKKLQRTLTFARGSKKSCIRLFFLIR